MDDSVECQRGDKTLGYAIGYSVGIVHMLAAGFAVTGTWLVYQRVQRQLDHMSSMSFDVESTRIRYHRRLRIVMWNATLYTTVFLNTFIVAVVCNALQIMAVNKFVNYPTFQMKHGAVIFIRLFCYTLFPAQGFLNWGVYVRSRVARIRRNHTRHSWARSIFGSM